MPNFPRRLAFVAVSGALLVPVIRVEAKAKSETRAQSKMPALNSILNKDAQLARFLWRDNLDNDWFKTNIPFFESPDSELDTTYYYRWEIATKHMTYGSPSSGYSFTEFINRPGWSGAYGSISCPLGLQLYETRWLRDRRIPEDFARYWFGAPGAEPRSYSNWYGDAVWANYLVSGDKPFVVSLLPSMEQQYQGWLKEHFDAEHQMFHWSSMHDGMEFTIGSRQTKAEFDGADSYRPTLNSYVYGDLKAMAQTARLAGEPQKAAEFETKATALKARIQGELWDEKRGFFLSQFANDEEKNGITIRAKTRMYEDGQFKGSPYGRELSGLVPWMFNLPDKGKGYEVAWKGITDPQVFLAPHGLYFTERRDPLFLVAQRSCVWSGNNWPYANAQVLQAMANVLNDYPQSTITKADYWKVLKVYADQHRKDGVPYIAETSDPDTGRWTQDGVQMSEHYFHSSFNDLVITGLAGLRPRADDVVEVNPLAPDDWNYFALDDVMYHGHNLSIIWDKTGQRYKKGKGLTLFADGKKLASAPRLGKLTANLPATTMAPTPARALNFVVNNDGTYFPRLRASFTSSDSRLADLNDGNFYYHQLRPRNRWTSQGSPNPLETLDVDFGIARPVSQVKLYVLDDGAGQAVRTPKSIALQAWVNGNWTGIPGVQSEFATPIGHCPNSFSFPALNTSKLRVILTPQAGSAVGLSEIEAWGDAALPLPAPDVADNLARTAKASASFTSRFDTVAEINDGQIVQNGGRNRWTAFESPNESDWVQLDFPKQITAKRMDVCLFTDTSGIALPQAVHVQWWDGANWQDAKEIQRAPAPLQAGTPLEIQIEPVQTDKLRLVFAHATPKKSGLTEWMVWDN
ncbi:beta-L-arabinobiosidase [Abditibacteriota bacterium]|nr:beta-L-arabinobiosidase [Abditibacteriota bacterium]